MSSSGSSEVECRFCDEKPIEAVCRNQTNAGKKYWSCPTHKQFIAWIEGAPIDLDVRAEVDACILVTNGQKLRALDHLFSGTFPEKNYILVTRKQDAVDCVYDSVKVEAAWRINRPGKIEKYKQKRTEMEGRDAGGTSSAVTVRQKNREVAAALLDQPLGQNEVLLLHGVSQPVALYDHIFKGEDSWIIARDREFGKGIYFSEYPSKCDDYCVVDEKMQVYNGKDGPLAELHKKLYKGKKRGVAHPKCVYYGLVSRVSLGNLAVTTDGTTRSDGKSLFADDKKDKLADGYDSLMIDSQPFREFVVFDPDQMVTEYLVAFKRISPPSAQSRSSSEVSGSSGPEDGEPAAKRTRTE